MNVVLASSAGPPVALAPAIREAVARVDAEVPLSFRTIQERMANALTERRFTMTLLLAFAGVALLLACVGIYGVVAYAVERRTNEIGIRMALGAEPAAVRRLVRRHFLGATAVGVLAGGAAALWLTRLMAALLYGVEPSDPLTFAATVPVLSAAAWLASYVPSLRASRVSPMLSMRAE
jgi:putative ABC transport system permease protein